MNPRTIVMACVIGGAPISCGGEAEEPMSELVQTLGTHLDEMSASAESHRGHVDSNGDLSAIRNDDAQYRNEMLSHHTSIVETLSMMGHCMRDMASPDTTSLADGAMQMKAELDDHAMRMGAASTVEEARSEESRHQAAVSGMISTMHEQHMAMEPMAMHFMCDHGEEADHSAH